MLNDEQLKIIKSEMEKGNPIMVGANIHDIFVPNVAEVRRQLFDKYGKEVIVSIIKSKILPSRREMAISAGKAIGNIAKRAVKGVNILAKKEEIEKRDSICNSCDYYEEGKCLKCGCFMKAKLKLQQSKCPLEKW